MKTQTLLLAAVLSVAPTVALAAVNDNPDPNDPGPSDPTTPTTPDTPEPTFLKNLFAQNCFPSCGSDWGAGYSVSARLAATPRTTANTRDKLEGFGQLDTFARVNGSRYSLFRVRLDGVSEAKVRTDLGLTAYVAGAAVFTQPFVSVSGTSTPISIGQGWSHTFFDRSVTVGVGPIPVTFRTRATGQLGASLIGKLSNVGFEAATGPSGKASLFASAAIGGQYCIDYLGCVGASAGVSANVTLVEAAAPITAALWWSLVNRGWGAQLNYTLAASLTLKSLDGWLKVFASACLGGCLDWDRTLISWPGATATYTLMNATGKFCLAGECTPAIAGVLQ